MDGFYGTFSTGSNAGVTIYDSEGEIVSQTVPAEWYREALRHIAGALGPMYSSWRLDHCPDCEEEMSLVLPLVYNVLSGLPPWAHTGQTLEEATDNQKRCEAAWLKRGLNVGTPRRSDDRPPESK